ncbi:O-antigen ligase family protein [Inquilinus sp. CAU 1745]|uniref:O-antigen ligase family protein n=1 Tax=Inquilinus sp. CAU 1745 TaxID=3140369 RepID=UPI00325B5478
MSVTDKLPRLAPAQGDVVAEKLPAFLFLIVSPLAVAAHLGVAALLIVGGVIAIAANPRVAVDARSLRPLIVLLIVLSLWAAASSVWSVNSQQSRSEIWKFLAVEAMGLVLLGSALILRVEARRRVLYYAASGISIAIAGLAVLAIMNYSGSFPVADYRNGATVVMLIACPIIVGLFDQGRRRTGIAIGLFMTIVVVAIGNEATKLALAVSIVVLPAALFFPKTVAAMIGLALATMIFLMPLASFSDAFVSKIHQMAPWIGSSGLHRLIIWGFTNDAIGARPFLGWGFDAAHYLPPGPALQEMPQLSYPVPAGFGKVPHHPHNAALQWRVELGLPGAILCLSIALWSLWRICLSGWSRSSKASALVAASATLTIASLSYGFWQTWWFSCIWLVAILTVACGRSSPDSRHEI